MGGGTLMGQDMIHIANALQAILDGAVPRLRAMSQKHVMHDRGAGKWNVKEILGHLIDSAANNQQRFVRARTADPLVFPNYDQNAWVDALGYRTRPWLELVDIWAAYNAQIAQIISSTPVARRSVRCLIGDNEAVTLEALMADYVRHVEHHLAQILPVETSAR
jgi:hypothetical protein